ncbi:glycosyl transferase group 1, partial [Natronococcus jeotgali DSM 18795]
WLVVILERGERSNGREAAREVSIERTADRMLSVYERAAGRRVAGRERAAVASR